jgi:selenocysteine lyase/cysteine desulfurase
LPRTGPYFKRRKLDAEREKTRADLAGLAVVSAEELIVTRKSTEAINSVFGHAA